MFRPIKFLWPKVQRPAIHAIKPFVNTRSHVKSSLRSLSTINAESAPPMSNEEKSWSLYRDRINRQDSSLTTTDFMNICKQTAFDNSIDKDTVITRIQTILRDIYERPQDPAMADVFVRACNMLMKAYISNGDMQSAKLVLEGLINTNHQITDVSITTLLHGMAQQGTKSDVYELIETLKNHNQFIENGNVMTQIIVALKKLRDLRGCRYFFAVMQEKQLEIDEVCYKTMIEVYKLSDQPDRMFETFCEMKEKGIQPSPAVYYLVLEELSKDKRKKKLVQDLFQEVKQSGQQLNVSMYLVMGYDPIDAMVDMKQAGMEFFARDYNACLAHYVKRNQFPKALDVFRTMNKNNITTDQYSYSILIDALAKDIDTPVEAVFDLYESMKRHDIKLDVVLYTSLISACSRSQDLDKAMHLLEEMEQSNVTPNIYTFNSLLGLMARMDNTSALDLDRASLVWSKMTSMDIHPDTRTFNVYLSILSRLIKPASPQEDVQTTSLWDTHDEQEKVPRTVREMLRMYRYMKRDHHHKTQPDFITYTIVINALASAGQLRSAMQVYDDAKLSRVVLPVSAYNELMIALQRSGKVSEAMNVWHDMRIKRVLPDNQSYEIVLDSCEQLGLTETIKNIRNQRKADFNRLLELEKQREKRLLNKTMK